MPLINCKVELSLNWIERCLLTVANPAIFKITDTKLFRTNCYFISWRQKAKLSKLLGKGFKRSIYWDKYKVIDNIVVEIAANIERST